MISIDSFGRRVETASKMIEKHNVEEHVETALHYMREHVFLTCVAVLGIYSVISWLNSWRKEVPMPSSSLSYLLIPR